MWGLSRTLVNNLVPGVTTGLHPEAGNPRRRLSRRGAGQEPAICSSASATTCSIRSRPASRSRREKPTMIDGFRHRQAVGRPGCGRNPRLSSAGALQGQGRALCGRICPPQGRQEEIAMTQEPLRPPQEAHALSPRSATQAGVRAFRFSARAGISMRRSSTIAQARPSRSPRPTKRRRQGRQDVECRSRDSRRQE